MTIPSLDPASAGAPPLIERCSACHHGWLTRRGFCPRCGTTDTRMEEVSGLGQVHAVTAVHRAVQPSALGPAPYTIALVNLTAEPCMRVMTLAAEPLAIGAHVEVRRHGEHGAPYLATPIERLPEHGQEGEDDL